MSVEYREILGFPGYRVGNDGTVWSKKTTSMLGRLRADWELLSPTTDKDGYQIVTLTNNGHKIWCKVHILVLEAFVGLRPDSGYVTRHYPNQDPIDNRLENLSWSTHKLNIQDKKEVDRQTNGEEHPKSRFSEKDVIKIRATEQYQYTTKQLADMYCVTRKAIRDIVTRKTWKHIK